MAVFKCKMCGGTLEVAEGQTVVTCDFCGTEQTVPSFDNEKKITLFKRANALRAKCEFDKAAGIYEAIISEFSKEAEAYWGLVLCRYGIEYVDDPKTGEKIPTCHRTQFASIFEDSDYKNTIKNANVLAKEVYQREAEVIAKLQKDILEISNKEEPFDVFICYKESEDGQRTHDSVLAQEIYDALTDKGYRVFFSRITLEDKLGSAYEPYIFAALHSSRVMIHVTTDADHSDAVWVRNEWQRYLSLISEGQKKVLIPAYKGMDAYDLPEEMQHLQAQDMGKIGSMQDLLRGIDKILSKKVIQPKVIKEQTSSSLEYDSLIRKGFTYLKNSKFEQADHCFDLALDAAELCGDAYLGKVLCEYQFSSIEELTDTGDEVVVDSENFVLAKEFASESCIKTLKDIEDKLRYNRLDQNYQNAMKLLDRGNYDDLDNARSIFEELGDFKDSKTMALEAVYRIAGLHAYVTHELKNIYKFEEVIETYKSLGDYSDSKAKIKEVQEIINSINKAYDEKWIKEIEYKLPKEATLNSLSEASQKYQENIEIFKQIDPMHDAISLEFKTIQEGIAAYVFNKANDVCNNFKSLRECTSLRVCIKAFETINDNAPIISAIEAKETELREIEKQKIKRKRIKTLKISSIVCAGIAICVATGIGINALVVANHKKNNYETATNFMESGNYEDAIRFYSENPDYENSQSKIDVCKGLINLQDSIQTKSEADAIKAIKQIVKAGEPVSITYISSNGHSLKRALRAQNDNSSTTQLIDSVDFDLYDPPINNGYTFINWYASALSYSNNLASLTMDSKWSTNVYNISYLLDGGTNNSSNPTKYTVEDEIILKSPSKTGYTFTGWLKGSDPISKIEKGSYGDLTLKANWSINKYKVRFLNYDDSILEEKTVNYGDYVSYTKETPLRNPDAQYTYTFSGWDKTVGKITSNTDFIAQYSTTINQYTVTFKNWDGSILGTSTVDYGSNASIGITPTKPNSIDDLFAYKFIGWDKSLTNVKENYEVVAQYEAIPRYLATFKNYDGTLLYSSRFTKGEVPVYSGADPVKPDDVGYNYIFNGWSPALTSITSDSVYFAQFTSEAKEYTVRFLNDDSSVLQTTKVKYGNYASYTNTTPTKEKTAQYSYSFNGWDKNPAETMILGNTDFIAQYTSSINYWSIFFYNYDGSLLGQCSVKYGCDGEYPKFLDLPTRPNDSIGYKFTGCWTTTNGGSKIDDLKNVVSTRNVYAQFEKISYKKISSATEYTDQRVGFLTDDNRFFTLGCNANSDLGFKATMQEMDSDYMIDAHEVVIPNEKIIDFYCAQKITVLLTESGKIYTGGTNDWCLGRQAYTTQYNSCFEAISLENIEGKVVKIFGNKGGIFAINNNGKLYSLSHNQQTGWGESFWNYGEHKNYTFYPVALDKKIKEVATCNYAVLALTEDGDLYRWGSNSYSIFGNGIQDTYNPTLVESFGVKFKQIVMGSNAYYALSTEGNLYVSGLNAGTDGLNLYAMKEISTLRDARFNGVSKIALGNRYAFAIMNDGKVYAWGNPTYGGSLGIDYSKELKNHIVSEPSLLNINSNIVIKDIYCGEKVTYAIDSNGQMYSWGYELGYQLLDHKSVSTTIDIPTLRNFIY